LWGELALFLTNRIGCEEFLDDFRRRMMKRLIFVEVFTLSPQSETELRYTSATKPLLADLQTLAQSLYKVARGWFRRTLEGYINMKVWTWLNIGLMCCFFLSCRSHKDSSSDLQGRPNSGGLLKLEKVYELVIDKDPRLMKGRDIKFLTYGFRDSSFGQFLVDELSVNASPLSCDLLDLTVDNAKSLITNVIEENGTEPGFRVFAADIRCEAPSSESL